MIRLRKTKTSYPQYTMVRREIVYNIDDVKKDAPGKTGREEGLGSLD